MENKPCYRMRILKYGTFSYTYVVKYWSYKRNTWKPADIRSYQYSDSTNEIYIEGEEDDVWEKIKSRLGHSNKKRITLSNQKITELVNFGESLAKKDGSINFQRLGRQNEPPYNQREQGFKQD